MLQIWWVFFLVGVGLCLGGLYLLLGFYSFFACLLRAVCVGWFVCLVCCFVVWFAIAAVLVNSFLFLIVLIEKFCEYFKVACVWLV